MTLGSKMNACALFFFHASMNNSMDRLCVYASTSKMSVHITAKYEQKIQHI